MAKKKQLTAEEEAELTRLWKKLVKLYHPDRFAHEPDKLETYHKLTSAINRAKDSGDIKTLREIAEDPHGFILRQGWASLDFSDEVELTQLRRLYETLQLEIITVLESLNRLRESPDYELCQLSEKTARRAGRTGGGAGEVARKGKRRVGEAGQPTRRGNQGVGRLRSIGNHLAVCLGLGRRVGVVLWHRGIRHGLFRYISALITLSPGIRVRRP